MADVSAVDPVIVESARITRMAARVFDVPVCMATVIDVEKTWIKSAVGFEPSYIDREPGLCEVVMSSGTIIALPDARLDPVAKLHSFVDTASGTSSA